MEKKESQDTNEASPNLIRNVEGDSFIVESEEDWEKYSRHPKTQNVDCGDLKFGNEHDLVDDVTSQAIGKT